jgi:hypothetical protein
VVQSVRSCRRREGRWLTDVSELRPLLVPGASCRFTLQVSLTFMLNPSFDATTSASWTRTPSVVPWLPCAAVLSSSFSCQGVPADPRDALICAGACVGARLEAGLEPAVLQQPEAPCSGRTASEASKARQAGAHRRSAAVSDAGPFKQRQPPDQPRAARAPGNADLCCAAAPAAQRTHPSAGNTACSCYSQQGSCP